MRTRVLPLVACLMWAPQAFSATAPPAPRIEAKVRVEPVRPMTAEERRATYIAAGRVLKHVDQARHALARQSRKEARRQVEQAMLLTEIIRQALPVYDVKAKISAGKLHYEDEDEVQDSVVPIYDELERAAILSPVEDAKAKGHEGAAVTDLDLVHTRAELDIDIARRQLQAAKSALEQRDLDAADEALAALQRSVRFHTVTVELPLERARSNLMLARDRVGEGRLEEARYALRVAIDALDEYANEVGKERATEARNLMGEISALEPKLQDDAHGVREKLDAWWDAISSWEE